MARSLNQSSISLFDTKIIWLSSIILILTALNLYKSENNI